jgi:hypothetical protein
MPESDRPETSGPDPQELDELAELALRAPDKIRDRLEGVPLERQAELAAGLPPRERLELLLHSPQPMRLVRTLPDGELYLTVREIGPTDALPLVALASTPQLLHLMDLESWRGDDFDPMRSGGWIALLLEAGEEVVRRFLRKADDELLVLLLQKWARVHQIESDDPPDRGGHGETESGTESGFLSPDGYHRFAPVMPEHGPAIRRLAEIFFTVFPKRYERLVWAALNEPEAEVEEMALKWRQSRLEEHGFAPWEEAVTVYAPPETPALREATADPSNAPRDGATADLPVTPGALLRSEDRSDLLVPALGRLDAARRESAVREIAALANRVLVADAADTGNPDAHRAAMRRVTSYLKVALGARGVRTDDDAAREISGSTLIELFREGYHRAVAIQERARTLVGSGWAAAAPEALELLDAPLRPTLRGLLMPRPMYFDPRAASEAKAYRDFGSIEQIEEATVAVRMAETLGKVFVDRLGVDVNAVLKAGKDLPHGAPLFSTLFLTAMAWNAAEGELRSDPLPADVTARFLRTVASRRTADPDSPARALREFLDDLVVALELNPHELTALRAFGTAALEKLEDECAGLDPGVPVDPRYVSCLLLDRAR